jgi:hypothetical protein
LPRSRKFLRVIAVAVALTEWHGSSLSWQLMTSVVIKLSWQWWQRLNDAMNDTGHHCHDNWWLVLSSSCHDNDDSCFGILWGLLSCEIWVSAMFTEWIKSTIDRSLPFSSLSF